MPKLSLERQGEPLKVNGIRIGFSFWPTRKRKKSYIRQVEILTRNPWDIIEHSISSSLDVSDRRRGHCMAFYRQAKDFYIASQNPHLSSRPLLLYYSFLNLAKATIIYTGIETDLDTASHGITEVSLKSSQREFFDASVRIYKNSGARKNIFDLLARSLGTPGLKGNETLSVVDDIAPQIVIGHRLWSLAAGKPERFVRCDEISFRSDKKKKEVWLMIKIDREDFAEVSQTHGAFMAASGLNKSFCEVEPNDNVEFSKYITLQQCSVRKYTRRPSDVIHKVVESLSQKLSVIIRSTPRYRRYYLYAPPTGVRRLHPLLAVYAMVFYLGSVTRYRPHCFEIIRSSPFGMLIDEVVSTQGPQFVYQFAAHFARRDVSMAAVIAG